MFIFGGQQRSCAAMLPTKYNHDLKTQIYMGADSNVHFGQIGGQPNDLMLEVLSPG